MRDRGDDIYLLFRKFASDYAEKYRVKSVSLTPEAIAALLNFRFPGNIRQLKNIVEQISVLEYDREISVEKLKSYLPVEQSNLLPVLSPQAKSSGSEYLERDLLYKVLFDMKKDMTDLKKLVFDLLDHQHSEDELLKQNQHLFENVGYTDRLKFTQRETKSESYLLPVKENPVEDYEEKVEDIPHETEEETLSLESKEKEMILKALKKHHNKRKYAAQDLGISERTLYRKLKQYDIEEQ